MLRVLDLFSGIGGFSLGLERTGGFQTVAFCEIDPYCRRVLSRHWPGVPIIDDVRTDKFPDADIIVGGFPCQDVSRAGKRAGVTGERSGLYRELVRAIRVVRPQYAILENVAALLGNGMGDVLGDLAEGGDCVEWDCVPASALGAPHQRDRVWIVAHAAGDNDQPYHSPEDERQVREPGDCPGTPLFANPAGVGCGEWRARRPPDSFSGIRDATRRHASDTHREGLEIGEGVEADARAQLPPTERAAFVNEWQHGWPCESALLGVDDGIPNRVDRTRALGNTLIPQIPELIGRAILSARE